MNACSPLIIISLNKPLTYMCVVVQDFVLPWSIWSIHHSGHVHLNECSPHRNVVLFEGYFTGQVCPWARLVIVMAHVWIGLVRLLELPL